MEKTNINILRLAVYYKNVLKDKSFLETLYFIYKVLNAMFFVILHEVCHLAFLLFSKKTIDLSKILVVKYDNISIRFSIYYDKDDKNFFRLLNSCLCSIAPIILIPLFVYISGNTFFTIYVFSNFRFWSLSDADKKQFCSDIKNLKILFFK